KAFSWGRNENGALGQGDTFSRAKPTLMALLKGTRIKHASCGKSHTALVTADG
ncbi:unnamed protein product, partial [Discosporangium mesarthrocarpum]